MADLKDAGVAIGGALKALKDRVDAVEAKEPNFTVPQPDITVAPVDLGPLAEALDSFTAQMAADASAQHKATIAMGQAIQALSEAVVNQEIKVEAMALDLDGVADGLIRALTAPKLLTFDENGEPVGVEVAATRVN